MLEREQIRSLRNVYMNNLTEGTLHIGVPRKDIVGNEIKMGDTVVYNPAYYKGLKHGLITGFTKQYVYVNGMLIKTGVAKVFQNVSS